MIFHLEKQSPPCNRMSPQNNRSLTPIFHINPPIEVTVRRIEQKNSFILKNFEIKKLVSLC